MSLISKFQSVQPSLLYTYCQPLKSEMGVFINPFKNKIKLKVLVFPVFRMALFAGSQIAPDCPSENRSIKIKQRIVKVKCTVVQALRLCTGRTAHRGSRGIALLFLDHGTRRWWGASVTSRPLFTPGKDPVPIVQEAGWAPGPVWTGAENVAPPGFDPRTLQPVASCYTDYATRPTKY